MRTCTDCGQTKPLVDFTPIKGTRWTHTRCKPCRAARARASQPPRAAKPYVPPGVRICTACGLVKPLDEFTPTNGATYRKKICKPCRTAAAKATYHHRPLSRPKRQLATERTCTECGVMKPIDSYTRIKSTQTSVYGRCRACRNARARARYHSSPQVRAAEIARATHNRLRRRGARAAT